MAKTKKDLAVSFTGATPYAILEGLGNLNRGVEIQVHYFQKNSRDQDGKRLDKVPSNLEGSFTILFEGRGDYYEVFKHFLKKKTNANEVLNYAIGLYPKAKFLIAKNELGMKLSDFK